MILVKWKDGSQTQYEGCNDHQTNGTQVMIGKNVDGVLEVVAAVPEAEIESVTFVDNPEGGASER